MGGSLSLGLGDKLVVGFTFGNGLLGSGFP